VDIPAFSNTNVVNWVPVSVIFDTADIPSSWIDPQNGLYVVFWVFVAVVKADTYPLELVQEIPSHGPLLPFDYAPAFLTLDETKNWIAPYSNNVGLYKHAFHIICPSMGCATNLLAAQEIGVKPKTSAPAAFQLGPVLVSSHRVARGERVKVSTKVDAGKDDVPGTTLLFYDGDPQDGGRVFDVERLAYVHAHDHHAARVTFRSNECGSHKLFVVAGKATSFEQVRSSGTVVVDCRS
jgi:hypothetical protein